MDTNITRYSWPAIADCLCSSAAVAASPFLPPYQLEPLQVVRDYETRFGPIPQVGPEAGAKAHLVQQLFREQYGIAAYDSGVPFGWDEMRLAQLLSYGIPVVLVVARSWDYLSGEPTMFHALPLTGYDDNGPYWHIYDQAAGQPWRQDLFWTDQDLRQKVIYQNGAYVTRSVWNGWAFVYYPASYGWGSPDSW